MSVTKVNNVRARHYIFITAGSIGDIFPIVSLAGEVRQHGSIVTVCAPATSAELVRMSGVAFRPLASEAESIRASRDLFLLATRYRGLFVRRHAITWNTRIYEMLCEMAGTPSVIITVGRGFIWADACASLHLGLPALRAHVDPPAPEMEISSELPHTSVQHMLRASFQRAWRMQAAAVKLDAGPYHLDRLIKHRRRLPAFGLFPQWLLGNSAWQLPAIGFPGLPALTKDRTRRTPRRLGGGTKPARFFGRHRGNDQLLDSSSCKRGTRGMPLSWPTRYGGRLL